VEDLNTALNATEMTGTRTARIRIPKIIPAMSK